MAKTKAEKWQILKKVIMAAVTLLIILYVLYVIGRAGFTQIKTVGAAKTTVYESISVNGYVVRGEQYVEYKGNGVISYAVSDGSKVSKGEAVANIFSDAALPGKQQQLADLESKLEALRQLEKNIGTFSQTPDEIDRSVNSLLFQCNIDMANGDTAHSDKNVRSILYYINERQLVTGKVSSYEEKIGELEKEIDSLNRSNASIRKNEQVNASYAGYFVSHTDGYEKSFSLNELNKLMPGSLSSSKIQSKEVSKNVIGKIVDKVYWYIVCDVSAEDAIKLKNAYSLKVNIPVVSNQNIVVELESLNQEDKSSDAVAVLKGTYMNGQMASIRNENMSIIIDDYTGIYVPKQAVHEKTITETSEESGKEVTVEKQVKGVYVQKGTAIVFRQIVPIYAGEDYVISDIISNLPDEQAKQYLQVYDKIVTEGGNLYDGKIVRRSS